MPQSLLPPNSSNLERAVDMLTAIRIGDFPVALRDLWNAETCPEHLLPWLAWGLSVDEWSPDWPLHVRRARVAEAIAIQRIKGTRKSVSDVVKSFGGNVAIREWFEQVPPGDPHTFALSVSLAGAGGAAPSADFIASVISEVARTKPVRSHFTFAVSQSATGTIGRRAFARPAAYARITVRGV